jgi:hypothetical protein
VNAALDPTTRRLARLLAVAYIRLVQARKAALDGQNHLDVARGNKAPLPTRRRARA